VLTSSLVAFPFIEERRKGCQPLLAAGEQVTGGQGIGEFLQTIKVSALEKCIGAFVEADVLIS
jgi:hypothetical protein